MITDDKLYALLKHPFGFDTFRKGQLEAIHALLHHNRLLCIQPTGNGKSLLYQLPSCLLSGLTLVISPLLALMRDQTEQLTSRFRIPAGSINTDQTEEENETIRRKAASGELKILFISPEQLDHIDRFKFFIELSLSLVVIDEAHCISTWGHDFRPSYRQILHFIQALEVKLPNVKILGLTATADTKVEADIKRQLSLSQALRESMDRPNIHLSVLETKGVASKLLLCSTLLTDLEGSGLIYCATRENTELVAEYLKQKGVSIIAYHAGLGSQEKRTIQDGFTKNQHKVVAATTALGMGIDKGDLRFIIHFDIPGSITAYYQEVGRCGRDGQVAQGLLLYDPADRKIQDYFIASALPSLEDFTTVVQMVSSAKEPPNLLKIKQVTGLHPTRVAIVLAELIEQQLLKKTSLRGSQVYETDKPDAPLDLTRYATQHLVKKKELQKIIHYAEQKNVCRMVILRETLGDKELTACGHCDICFKTNHKKEINLQHLSQTLQWLIDRPIPIAETKLHTAGVSLLDGKLRTPLFVQFMKQRSVCESIEEELLPLLKKQAEILAKLHSIQAIVPLPSRTWKGRVSTALALAKHLQVDMLLDALFWKIEPEKRQGELLNNDQRRHNVQKQMQFQGKIPSGPILLLDDYIGSGATMKEAARALAQVTDQPLVPLTIATIKWHLGKPGFV